ncbi:RNA-directed DNA polymerase [Microbacteriaceae bacterium VKM Ac-2855]|nr:RNA-directed DNA polymerase [Microbacteriaceae bacterium VKM Ac-2855]
MRAALRRAVKRGTPVIIAHHVLAEPVAPASASPVPRLASVTELAAALHLEIGELEWFADTRLQLRRASSTRLQHYRYEWRERPGRLPRLLEVPGRRLRAAQRAALDAVIGLAPLHDAAHGFVPGRSARTGAERHVGSEVVIALDLTTFFARVTARDVYRALRAEGLPESVAYVLTGLCTHAVPYRVAAHPPRGGDLDERFALQKALTVPHLPQGAPTSPALANLCVRRLDARLAGYAEAAGAVYTRYADDLAFSGGPALARRADAFARGVRRIVASEGHELNDHKTRIRTASVRQSVTGIVVNTRPNVTRAEYDALKATLHNCIRDGPASQNRAGHAEFRAHLLGRISWIASLNPARGERLRAEFDRIPW